MDADETTVFPPGTPSIPIFATHGWSPLFFEGDVSLVHLRRRSAVTFTMQYCIMIRSEHRRGKLLSDALGLNHPRRLAIGLIRPMAAAI